MAQYVIEWTEHTKKRAVIEAPPNDEYVLQNAQIHEVHPQGVVADTPVVIVWAEVDGKVETVRDADDKPAVTFDITLIGRMVEVPCGKNLMEQKVVPL